MTAILEQLQGLVAAAEIPAGTLGVALILGLFGLMVVGLVLGQELAFVLGGAGVIVGWLAWGRIFTENHRGVIHIRVQFGKNINVIIENTHACILLIYGFKQSFFFRNVFSHYRVYL